tara:strand:+ start:2022 stop:3155 length:1134 start_codon:yes stop_codon:yes gene_type:complete
MSVFILFYSKIFSFLNIMEHKYHVKKLFTGNKIIENICVITNENKIIGIDKKKYEVKSSYEIMIPGYIDLQVYGALGSLFMEESNAKTIEKINSHNIANGTFHFQPTIASESNKKIIECIDAVKEYWLKGGKGCIGLHVEGPWINPKKNGAHSLKHIHSPKIDEVKEILSYANGSITMITLAPEVVSDDIIKLLKDNQILISVGHSNMNSKTAFDYFEKGINTVTHLFNAMPPLHHRDPGLVHAVLENTNVYSSIICDGHHVDFDMIRLAHTLKKDKLFCITDSVTESSKGDYIHKLNGEVYENNGVLSGSSITMHKSFKNLIEKVGLSISEAVNMCCITPGKVIEKTYKVSSLELNSNSPFNILDTNLEIVKKNED